VDGALVGTIRRRQSIYYDVAPGKHTVQLRIDWCESPPVELDLRAGDVAALVCSARMPRVAPPAGAAAGRYISLDLEGIAPA
jgi:hypothetical protein